MLRGDYPQAAACFETAKSLAKDDFTRAQIDVHVVNTKTGKTGHEVLNG